jgi:hypothetical protein
MKTLLALSFVGLVGVSGCATSPQQTAMAPVDTSPEAREVSVEGIKVRLVRIYGDIITCEVINLAAEPVLVDRDAIELVTPTGEHRKRLPGGAQTTYQVPPSGSHVVNVRYDLAGVLDEDVARLDFSHAVLRAGQPVAVPPLPIKPKQQTN